MFNKTPCTTPACNKIRKVKKKNGVSGRGGIVQIQNKFTNISMKFTIIIHNMHGMAHIMNTYNLKYVYEYTIQSHGFELRSRKTFVGKIFVSRMCAGHNGHAYIAMSFA
jgi:hypothetical protein